MRWIPLTYSGHSRRTRAGRPASRAPPDDRARPPCARPVHRAPGDPPHRKRCRGPPTTWRPAGSAGCPHPGSAPGCGTALRSARPVRTPRPSRASWIAWCAAGAGRWRRSGRRSRRGSIRKLEMSIIMITSIGRQEVPFSGGPSRPARTGVAAPLATVGTRVLPTVGVDSLPSPQRVCLWSRFGGDTTMRGARSCCRIGTR